MMRLRLKTKFTLTTALLVTAVVALTSAIYVATLTRQVIRQTDDRGRFIALQLIRQAEHALADAEREGYAAASESPADMHTYVRETLSQNVGLNSQIDTVVGYSPLIYEVTVVDQQNTAFISSDPRLRDTQIARRPQLKDLANAGLVQQLRAVLEHTSIFEVDVPFNLGKEPFGEIRIAMQIGLLRNEIEGGVRRAVLFGLGAVIVSTLLAALVSHASLAPLAQISAQLDRISAGEFDRAPETPEKPGWTEGDELGQVSHKITQVGQELRGVREIFSTYRENMDQFMSGLEDGLLLFTRDGRAVMVSPSVENFLGAPAGQLLGRRVSEIFPPGHPLRQAVRIEGEAMQSVAAAEVELDGAGGANPQVRRARVSVQVISEGGTRMVALVTLRDLESRERIGTQLQVSERLAAMGRVTAGVAHEVKNPLNSMRLWLENLKDSIPADQEVPQQAVQVLDSEISRLDSVVKRFLDFNRPVEMRLEQTNLRELLAEVLAIAQPQILRAAVHVETRWPGPVPPVYVDRELLKQAVLNLILNAVDAMPTGGRLTLGVERHGEMAEVSVADTGRGIPPEHRERIFQLFFTTRKGGSGIGLASTYRTVQMHNGSIEFESEVGRGTTFRIELPLAHPVAHSGAA